MNCEQTLGHPIEKPETIATAIRIGNPASWKTAEEARDESGGLIDCVSDDEIINAYKILARNEGVFVEPASAASVAGMLKLAKAGYFNSSLQKSTQNKNIVCILTGHGLKDPDRALKSIQEPIKVKADLKAILHAIGF